jgi:hypothetical protein
MPILQLAGPLEQSRDVTELILILAKKGALIQKRAFLVNNFNW